jgi:hypothetical protein
MQTKVGGIGRLVARSWLRSLGSTMRSLSTLEAVMRIFGIALVIRFSAGLAVGERRETAKCNC